ncbi:MAG: efflux RND transporter periplasmic adaptor subunit [Acidobacteriaceae bacterium]|nr:efflux RND transporter periplasmic adaptor subunit [Acidobacteriaceae bacterium]
MIKSFVFTLITLGLVTTLSSCRQAVQANSEPAAVPVQLRAPAVVDHAESVSASGSVEGSETADVAFLVGGRVARVFVEEGQHVRKGQLLAELESTDYRNAFDAAAAQRSAAQAIAEKADAGVRKQELEQARIEYERSADEYKRMKFLVERKSLPPNDFQKVEAAYNAAHERYQMAQEGTRKEDRVTALEQARAAAAQTSEEQKRLSDTRLVAPISGNIGMRKLEAGQSVAPGTAVFTIVDLNPAKVRVGVPEAEIARVKLGAKASITVPSLAGRQFEGRIGIIGVSAEPASRTYTVKIVVPNPGPVLLAGMVAEARIFGSAKVHALTVPGEAIVHDPQGAPAVFVYFPDRKRVYAHKVEVGPPLGEEVEIRSGLRADEQVVVAGQQKLREGMLVEVGGGAQ